jgi:nicotinate phosphoribosyltransferase
MRALHTDLYQLIMAAGYFQAGKVGETATFELFVRRLPPNREFLVAAGAEQAVDYLVNLRFTGEQIQYLRTLPQFALAPPEFFTYLEGFRFTGDLFAMREGTPFFPGEPVLTVRAPIIEAQIPETYLLATVSFQSMIASKAVRVARAAQDKGVVEFGTRRAHSPEAGVLAGRASYIGGCIGTSNVEAGMRYGIPVFGTSAHSWVQSFESEEDSFRKLQRLLGPATVYLIDTNDTLEGARKASKVGRPMWGVRLDSGNLPELAFQVRRILDEAGLVDAKIMATSDLNEDRIEQILAAGAPIDAFGVGTELATSADAPALSAVYKLVEVDTQGIKRYKAKYSQEKQTMPGAKQVFRYADRDVIACASECDPLSSTNGWPEPLLRPVIIGGRPVADRLPAARIREYCLAAQYKIIAGQPVGYSADLLRIAEQHGRGQAS